MGGNLLGGDQEGEDLALPDQCSLFADSLPEFCEPSLVNGTPPPPPPRIPFAPLSVSPPAVAGTQGFESGLRQGARLGRPPSGGPAANMLRKARLIAERCKVGAGAGEVPPRPHVAAARGAVPGAQGGQVTTPGARKPGLQLPRPLRLPPSPSWSGRAAALRRDPIVSGPGRVAGKLRRLRLAARVLREPAKAGAQLASTIAQRSSAPLWTQEARRHRTTRPAGPQRTSGCCVELLLLLLAGELPLGGGCPRDCVCYPAPMTVSCQAHNFAAIPEGIPEDSERIFLQNNRITVLQQGHFSPAMVTLWIYSNNITFIDPNTFEGFVHLEELDLGDNRQLRTLAPETFQGLVKLHALYLYKCGLSALPAGIFGGLHSLQYLYLQDNHIEYLQDDIFVDLVNLSHLFLHGNKLWSLGQDTFRGLVNLDRLLLHENQLQWVHHKAFHDLRRLTTLFLFNNSLSELQGDCLAPLGALEFLRLNGNAWDCGCRAHSLWEWLRRFRGSSSAVPCASPEARQGQDLKLLRAEDFRNCTGPASPHQIKSHTLTTTDRAARKEHYPPRGPARDKGHPHGHLPGSRPGYRKPGKNCTSHRNRNQVSKAGAGKQAHELQDYAPDYQHKFSFDIMPTTRPKRKGKCARRTPIRAPSGVQQASSGSSLGASLLAWILGLVVTLR
ncbi:reticulon-4 receptor-like 1 [Enhydra lutris kenyoni]|uniref:Reticulon-4 receptor-like 1 n=1 Tax=Enhydra lutris kenyoni TaxID=391180 RepID=A0A2Y9JWB5_ENHLU|nr:reticulon-4 receptor-like 1 [Enhydra lutris kenyoni]